MAKVGTRVELRRRGQTGWFVHVDGARVGYVEQQVVALGRVRGARRGWVAYRVAAAGFEHGFDRVDARDTRRDAVALLTTHNETEK